MEGQFNQNRRRLVAAGQHSGNGVRGSTPRKWEIYDYATDCASSDYTRLIHPRETWVYLQDAYAHSRGSEPYDDEATRQRSHHAFTVPFEVRDDGPRGRSVYAAEVIPKGTKFYLSDNIVGFGKPSGLNNFLRLLPHDLQCDVLLWAWSSNHGASLCLDEGSFINHGEEESLITTRNTESLRDLRAGEELLEDYGDFIRTEDGWFNEIRARAWGKGKVEEGGAAIDEYTSQGAVRQEVAIVNEALKNSERVPTPLLLAALLLFGLFLFRSQLSYLWKKGKRGL